MNIKEEVLYHIPRSGSTLIYNLLKEVLPNINIIRTISYYSPCDETIVVFRDFRDLLVSHCKLLTGKKGKLSLFDIFWHSLKVKRHVRSLNKYCKSSKRILWLRYEYFYDDIEHIFNSFERFYFIKIPIETRTKLKEKYSIENMKKIASKLKDYREKDKETQIRGNHIQKVIPNRWYDEIPKRYHFLVYLIYRRELLQYGYHKYKFNWRSNNDK